MPTQYIFTVTPGRSGTKSLQHVLAAHPYIHAAHEERPFISMEMLRRDPPFDLRGWFARVKWPVIQACDKPTYIDTSHIYCKGYLEMVVEQLGRWPDLIILRRDPRAVALSLFRLMDIPGRSITGRRYYLSPDDKWLMTTLSEDFLRRAHPYQLCYWYVLAIQRRMDYYAGITTGRVYNYHAEDIGNRDAFEAMLDYFGLSTDCADFWETYNECARHNYNRKYGRKYEIAKRLTGDGTRDIVSLELMQHLPELEQEVVANIVYREPAAL